MTRALASRGFATITVIVSLCILILLIGSMWYITKRNHRNDASKELQVNTTQNTSVSKRSKYLDIQEWNVQVKIPASMQGDISYFVNTRAEKDTGGPLLIDFVSKRFSAGALKCGDIEDGIPRSLVSIYRELDSDGIFTNDPQPFKKIANTRYYFSTTSCEESINREGTPEDKQLITDLKQLITNTLRTKE